MKQNVQLDQGTRLLLICGAGTGADWAVMRVTKDVLAKIARWMETASQIAKEAPLMQMRFVDASVMFIPNEIVGERLRDLLSQLTEGEAGPVLWDLLDAETSGKIGTELDGFFVSEAARMTGAMNCAIHPTEDGGLVWWEGVDGDDMATCTLSAVDFERIANGAEGAI